MVTIGRRSRLLDLRRDPAAHRCLLAGARKGPIVRVPASAVGRRRPASPTSLDLLNGMVLVMVAAAGLLTAAIWMRKSVIATRDRPRGHRADSYYAVFLLCATGFLGITITGDVFNLYVFLEIASITSYVLIAMGRATAGALRRLQLPDRGQHRRDLHPARHRPPLHGDRLAGDGRHRRSSRQEPGALRLQRRAHLLRVLHGGPRHQDGALPAAWLAAERVRAGALAASICSSPPPRRRSRPTPSTASRSASSGCDSSRGRALPVPCIRGASSSWRARRSSSGPLLAIRQGDLKRLLAYSSVGQIGYIMLGVVLLNESGLTGGIIHFWNHAAAKGALFCVAGRSCTARAPRASRTSPAWAGGALDRGRHDGRGAARWSACR